MYVTTYIDCGAITYLVDISDAGIIDHVMLYEDKLIKLVIVLKILRVLKQLLLISILCLDSNTF